MRHGTRILKNFHQAVRDRKTADDSVEGKYYCLQRDCRVTDRQKRWACILLLKHRPDLAERIVEDFLRDNDIGRWQRAYQCGMLVYFDLFIKGGLLDVLLPTGGNWFGAAPRR